MILQMFRAFLNNLNRLYSKNVLAHKLISNQIIILTGEMMNTLLELFFFNIIILILYLIIRLILIKKFKFNLHKDVMRIIFIIYISSLMFFVWIRGRFYSDTLHYNFIPFKTIVHYVVLNPNTTAFKNIFGNIFITLPFGVFIYFRKKTTIELIKYALLIPLIIELGQLVLFIFKLNTRTVDIDDFLLNLSGIILGYILTKLALQKSKL